jgi:PKD repeat protein/murein DD-endopeptidase MepM/ murein hydrolase activator NlpD/pimeloyl-ACP methyl ester carboxylesterase
MNRTLLYNKLLLALLLLIGVEAKAQLNSGNPEYPIIFVHGWTGANTTWIGEDGFATYLSDALNIDKPQIFNACANHDGDNTTSILEEDVDFVGWADSNQNPVNLPSSSGRLFVLNLDNETFPESGHEDCELSNQSAPYKAGMILKQMIQDVLETTGEEKVILLGHSLGGLKIREYLQRKEDGKRRWWIEPDKEDGHHVARVVTIGTPHGGSALLNNLFTSVAGFNSKSDAIRDLRWKYNSSSYGCGFFQEGKGMYLFGGEEKCFVTNLLNPFYYNSDVNCNGVEDVVIGLNNGDNTTTSGLIENPSIALPRNILYTWVISCDFDYEDWQIGNSGDGVVGIERQSLYTLDNNKRVIPYPLGVARLVLTSSEHLSQTGDFDALLSGLDLPKSLDRAPYLFWGKAYGGFFIDDLIADYNETPATYDEICADAYGDASPTHDLDIDIFLLNTKDVCSFRIIFNTENLFGSPQIDVLTTGGEIVKSLRGYQINELIEVDTYAEVQIRVSAQTSGDGLIPYFLKVSKESSVTQSVSTNNGIQNETLFKWTAALGNQLTCGNKVFLDITNPITQEAYPFEMRQTEGKPLEYTFEKTLVCPGNYKSQVRISNYPEANRGNSGLSSMVQIFVASNPDNSNCPLIPEKNYCVSDVKLEDYQANQSYASEVGTELLARRIFKDNYGLTFNGSTAGSVSSGFYTVRNFSPCVSACDDYPNTCTCFHKGLDYKSARRALSIYSPIPGRVINVQKNTDGTVNSFGTIAIYNEKINATLLLVHNSEIAVNTGDIVQIGTYLGKSGQQGNATGIHVHAELRPGRRDTGSCTCANTHLPVYDPRILMDIFPDCPSDLEVLSYKIVSGEDEISNGGDFNRLCNVEFEVDLKANKTFTGKIQIRLRNPTTEEFDIVDDEPEILLTGPVWPSYFIVDNIGSEYTKGQISFDEGETKKLRFVKQTILSPAQSGYEFRIETRSNHTPEVLADGTIVYRKVDSDLIPSINSQYPNPIQRSISTALSCSVFAIEIDQSLFQPNGDAQVQAGDIKSIPFNATDVTANFRTTNATNVPVNISLSVDSGFTYQNLASNYTGASYAWDVPDMEVSGNRAFIKVEASDNTRAFDITQGFNIIPLATLPPCSSGICLGQITSYPTCWGDNILLPFNDNLPSCYTYIPQYKLGGSWNTFNPGDYSQSSEGFLCTVPEVPDGVYEFRILGISNCVNDFRTQFSNIVRYEMNAPPTVSIALNGPDQFCENSPSTLIATASDAILWEWFLDGSSLGFGGNTFTPTQTGCYSAKAISSEQCEKLTEEICVTVLEVADLKPIRTSDADNSICQNEQIQFFSNVLPNNAVLTWDFGDGNTSTEANPIHEYETVDVYTITLKAYVEGAPECEVLVQDLVEVRPKPLRDITIIGNLVSCSENPTRLRGPEPPPNKTYIYQWSRNNQLIDQATTLEYVPLQDGVYYVIIEDNQSQCTSESDKVEINYQITPTSTIGTSSDTVCLGETIDFVANTTNPSNSIISYIWDWKDGSGNTALLQNSSYEFSASGIYDVELKTIGDNLCESVVTRRVYVQPKPQAGFEMPSFGCLTQNVELQNTSGGNSVPIAGYYWQFPNGQFSQLVNPTYEPTYAGLHEIKLEVRTIDGCVDSISKTIEIAPTPATDFTVDTPVCARKIVQFVNETPTLGYSVSHEWDLDDSKTSSQANPIAVYSNSGIKEITLISSYELGTITCSSSKTKTIFVPDNPFAEFENTTVCEGEATVFTDLSYNEDNTAPFFDYAWEFGENNQTSNEKNPSYTYTKAGAYQVILTVRNIVTGCTDEVVKTVRVLPRPISTMTFTRDCTPNQITFDVNASVAGGTLQSYFIDFGDGQTAISASNSFTHTYDSTDSQYPNFEVKVISFSFSGCGSDTFKLPITVFPQLLVDFTSSPVCLGGSTQFASLIRAVNPIARYAWNFGDGTNSSEINPSHIYAFVGTYDVTLEVEDVNGCIQRITKQVNVNTPDATQFSLEDSAFCVLNIPQRLNFTDQTGNSTASWFWQVADSLGTLGAGNSHTTTEQNPYLVLNQNLAVGYYPVKLVTTSNFGCKDSLIKYIRVFAPLERQLRVQDDIYRCETVDYTLVSSGDFLEVGDLERLEISYLGNTLSVIGERASFDNQQVIFSFSLPRDTVDYQADFTLYSEREGTCGNSSFLSDSITQLNKGIFTYAQEDESREVEFQAFATQSDLFDTEWRIIEQIPSSCNGVLSLKISELEGESVKHPFSVFSIYPDRGDTRLFQVEMITYDKLVNIETCKHIYTDSVFVDYTNRLKVPTAFTPNGDGVNDYFEPEPLCRHFPPFIL